jgi:hypothetical protein
LVGLGKKFLHFPKTRQTIRYGSGFSDDYYWGSTIITRSQDGLQLELDVSFQYQLNIVFDDLFRLYMDFGDSYSSQYARVLLQVAADVSSDYEASEFFTNREVIQEAMRIELNTVNLSRDAVSSFSLLWLTSLCCWFCTFISHFHVIMQQYHHWN